MTCEITVTGEKDLFSSALKKKFVKKNSFSMNLYLMKFSEVAQINLQSKRKKKKRNPENSKHCGENRHAALESIRDHFGEHQLIIF